MVNINKILENDVIVAWSGGLDSTCLIYLLLRDYTCKIHPYFVNRGQKNQKFELKAIDYYSNLFYSKQFVTPISQISVKIPADEFDKFGPEVKYALRNSDILNQGIRVAISRNITTVLIATFEEDDKYRDGSAEFLELKTCEAREGTGNTNFQVRSPFHHSPFAKTKSEILKICTKMGLDLFHTRSCYEDTTKHCGVCSACSIRKEAFKNSGIKDETEYV